MLRMWCVWGICERSMHQVLSADAQEWRCHHPYYGADDESKMDRQEDRNMGSDRDPTEAEGVSQVYRLRTDEDHSETGL